MSKFKIIHLRHNARALILIAAFFFTAMSACVKAVADQIPLYEIIFVRAFLSVLVLGFFLKQRKISFRAKNLPLMLTRSLSGLAAMSCNFYALSHLAFGDAATLVNTFPVFVAILSFVFLKERPTQKLTLLIALSWMGILLILRPQFNFLNFSGLIALLAAIFSAIVIVVIHQTHETDPSLRIAFYFTAICSFVAFPIMLQNFVMPNLAETVLLLGAGLFGTGGQIAMTKAYGLDDVSRLAPLSYVGVVLAFGMGILFWKEVPSLWSLAGSLLVILACIQIARIEKPTPVMES